MMCVLAGNNGLFVGGKLKSVLTSGLEVRPPLEDRHCPNGIVGYCAAIVLKMLEPIRCGGKMVRYLTAFSTIRAGLLANFDDYNSLVESSPPPYDRQLHSFYRPPLLAGRMTPSHRRPHPFPFRHFRSGTCRDVFLSCHIFLADALLYAISRVNSASANSCDQGCHIALLPSRFIPESSGMRHGIISRL